MGSDEESDSEEDDEEPVYHDIEMPMHSRHRHYRHSTSADYVPEHEVARERHTRRSRDFDEADFSEDEDSNEDYPYDYMHGQHGYRKGFPPVHKKSGRKSDKSRSKRLANEDEARHHDSVPHHAVPEHPTEKKPEQPKKNDEKTN